MIRLRKGATPTILAEKAATWTEEYRQALASGAVIKKTVRFRYRHKDVKAAVKRDSHGKCIYCETPTEFGQTDHINPVSKCPDRVVDWDNLAFVCTECNTHKSDYYDPDAPLVNPFVDDPAEFLSFLGPFVMAAPDNHRGQLTLLQLKLNRPDLFQRRFRRLTSLEPLLHQ